MAAETERTPDQVWDLVVGGREHRVEARGSAVHRVRWLVDGAEVASGSRMDERFTLTPEDDDAGLGEVRLVFSSIGHGRRATLAPPGEPEVDLVPEPGSPAARYEARVREHPRRYAAIAAGTAVAKVLGGIAAIWLISRLVVRVPWPDWNLPSIPWPDLPSIPWPDIPLPSFSTPWWFEYLVPVLIAVAIALYEVRRRRKQDERRQAATLERPRPDEE